uniref:Uncharacterized protein n=1 Tax=Meloidogyne enterolobii TaxID=390850 RepID=A0A6V7WPA8_MELEN|nr:unnamed protein product [Meloidogyne enterolobii]
MPGRKRLLTAISFFTLAIALYSWSVFPKKLELSAMLICLSHIAYLLSFYRSLRKWWVALTVSTLAIVSLFLYGVFRRSLSFYPCISCCNVCNYFIIHILFYCGRFCMEKWFNYAL